MTTILLILVLSFLSLWHQLGLTHWVKYILQLPSGYYNLMIILVVVIRIGWAIYKFYLRVVPAASRFSSALQRLAGGDSSSSPFGRNGAKRKFSTSSKPSLKPKASSSNPLLATTKVKDQFFRTVAKRGSLVSLLGGRARKGLPSLANLFEKMGFRMFSAVFPQKGKYLSRIRQLNAFRVHITNKVRHNGASYTVKYLKVSSLALQKAIAGTPVSSLSELEPGLRMERLTRKGLPSWIPIRDRNLILLNRSGAVIRWYLTLFSVYRVISIPGILKLSTITDPLSVPIEQVMSVASDIKLIIPKAKFDLSVLTDTPPALNGINLRANPSIPMIEAASSTGKISWVGMLSDLLALRHTGSMVHLIEYLRITKNETMLKLFSNLTVLVSESQLPINNAYSLLGPGPVGRLALKEEPAGKVRVFAMCTLWDQAILEPLHSMLFKFLKSLPNDGTFDQELSVKRCLAKSTLTNNSFGYDLSAATDRLPVSLQAEILNSLLTDLGTTWSKVLTDRDYVLRKSSAGGPVKEEQILRYSVGQPMGALSSWAMLAVTHHLIAQLAAFNSRAYGISDPHHFWVDGWYTGYEVLGDDIVFFEEYTATQYLTLMDLLGVPINLSKSVVAKNPTFEFAKVTGHYGEHVAALSWAMFMAQPTMTGRVGIIWSLLRKGFVKTHIIRYITALSRQSKTVKGSPNLTLIALGTMFSNAGRFRFSEFLYSILSFKDNKVLLDDVLNKPLTPLSRSIAAAVHEGVQEITISRPLTSDNDVNVSTLAIKMVLVQAIKLFVYGKVPENEVRIRGLNPYQDAVSHAKNVVSHMIGFTPEGKEDLLSRFEEEGAFDLRPRKSLSVEGKLVHLAFTYVFSDTFTKFHNIWSKLRATKPLELKGLPIEELFHLLDEIDRYKEVMDLWARAQKKLSKEEVPSKNLIESPLKVLTRVLKSETKIENMRRVVISAGTEVITKIFARSDTASYSIFSSETEENPGYRPSVVPVSLDGVKTYIASHGEEFVKTHLPKWADYAGYMFQQPKDVVEPALYNKYMGQPEYLYSLGYIQHLDDVSIFLVPTKDSDESLMSTDQPSLNGDHVIYL